MHQRHKNELLGSVIYECALQQGLLIPEEHVTDTNTLFDLAIIPRDLQTTLPHSSSHPDAARTHTPQSKSRFILYFLIHFNFFTILTMHTLMLPFYYSPQYAAKHQSST